MRRHPYAPTAPVLPSEDLIRDYAYHLFVQNGCVPGHDLDNWLEAKACLCAHIPRDETHTRLHSHLKHGNGESSLTIANLEARNLST